MSNPVVWFEVMGQNADKLRSFYGNLLGWKFNTDNPMNYGLASRMRGGDMTTLRKITVLVFFVGYTAAVVLVVWMALNAGGVT